MVGAAGAMVFLAACALLGGWLMVLRSDRGSRGPGSPDSPVQIGRAAPDFTLYALDETQVSLSDLRGVPVALNFWAMWCLPCRLETGALNGAASRHPEEGLVVVGIDVRERPSEVIAYAEREGLEFLVLLDPHGAVADAYGIAAMPTTIWVDRDGTVSGIDTGVLTDQRIDAALKAMTAPTD